MQTLNLMVSGELPRLVCVSGSELSNRAILWSLEKCKADGKEVGISVLELYERALQKQPLINAPRYPHDK